MGKITLTQGHAGALSVRREADGAVAYFPGRTDSTHRWLRILTGMRDRLGQALPMSARDVRAHFRVTPQLQNPGDTVNLDHDGGLFDPLAPDDILRHAHRVHGIFPTAPSVLARACMGDATQRRERKTD
jgi:hypothetical protein